MEGADNHLYHAYAPDPIVLDTIRKGTLTGSGANCECGMPFIVLLAVGSHPDFDYFSTLTRSTSKRSTGTRVVPCQLVY